MTRFTPETILRLAREDTHNFEIIDICMEELRQQAIKALPSGNKILVRRNAAKKYINAIDDNRPGLKRAWEVAYNGREGCQAFCNGTTGIILYEPLDGLPGMPYEGEELRLASLMPGVPDDYVRVDVDLAQAAAVAKSCSKYEKPVFEIGRQIFDPGLIIPVAAILGKDITFHVSGKDDYALMYLVNDNGVAVVLPLRK